ncbi:MAG: mutarotase, partial [Bacteroidota bacterium]
MGKPDDRYGISLIVRPPLAVIEKIQTANQQLTQIEPDQYYYPTADVHTTVLSIINCTAGFQISQIDLPSYIQRIEEALSEATPFDIDIRGIAPTSVGIISQGYNEDSQLNQIRNRLRGTFRESPLLHMILSLSES